MDNSDDREGAPGGQARKPDQPVSETSQLARMTLDPHEYYFTEDITSALRVSVETLDFWAENGLKRVARKKLKMKSQVYFGDLILEYLRQNLE